MLKQICVAECDICGKIKEAKTTLGQYNETEYLLPDGWESGKGNKAVCICTECLKLLSKGRESK